MAFELMLDALGDKAFDISFFNSIQPPFQGRILRTTWEELTRQNHVELIGSTEYRLTPSGWLVALEASGTAQSPAYQGRLGELFAAMKQHVKGRSNSAIVPLRQLADESGEPEGWVFNVIDCKAGDTGNKRTRASWYGGERGRLIEIPVDFNLEPIDIAAALTVQHLERVEQLEQRLKELEEDRAQFHCPYCDAPVSGVHMEDYPDDHCVVTYEEFECGYTTADGGAQYPCPYGPHWPALEEFEFVAKQEKNLWVCWPVAKTDRARQIYVVSGQGRTREEAEENARKRVARKVKQKSV